MKFERKKNVVRSVRVGFIAKISDCVFQFILRNVLINSLGILYLGLNSLFVSILGILSLSELGLSSVIIFSMYKPIADDDTDKIKTLLAFYKKCYKIIGLIILSLGICFTPFIKLLIKGDYPQDTNIYIIYLINLINTVLSYLLFAYKSSILEAHQRNDLVSLTDFITNIIKYLLQIILLIGIKNYYAYLIVVPITTIVRNLILQYYSMKYYPRLIVKGASSVERSDLDEIKTQVKGMIFHKAGDAVFQYVDSIVISTFFGLGILGIYNNYYYILVAVGTFFAIISNTLMPGIGNLIATESKEKNEDVFKKINMFYYWAATIGSCCFACLYQPFMKIWMGEEYLLNDTPVFFLSVLFYVLQVNNAVGVYKGALGLYWQDRYRPLLSAGVNLIFNLILSYYWGINGVIISSVIANIFVDFPFVSVVLFTKYFKNSPIKYIRGQYFKTIISLLILCISFVVVVKLPNGGYTGFLLKAIVCFIISNILFLLFNFWNHDFRRILVDASNYLKKRYNVNSSRKFH